MKKSQTEATVKPVWSASSADAKDRDAAMLEELKEDVKGVQSMMDSIKNEQYETKAEIMVMTKRMDREKKLERLSRMPIRGRARTHSTHSTGACSSSSSNFSGSMTSYSMGTPVKPTCASLRSTPIVMDVMDVAASPLTPILTPDSRDSPAVMLRCPGSGVLRSGVRVRVESDPVLPIPRAAFDPIPLDEVEGKGTPTVSAPCTPRTDGPERPTSRR